MYTSERLMVFLPVFNEGSSIYETGSTALTAVGKLGLEHTLLFVNDGSTDDTAQQAQRLRLEHPATVTMVGHKTNQGYGRALRTGLEAGLAGGYDLVASIDGDGQFDPNDLSRLLATMQAENADGVIGYRQNRQDRRHRLLLGRAWKSLSNTILDCGMTDIDCGMKLFRRSLLEAVVPKLISTVGAAISPEIVNRGLQAGYSFSEVGVNHFRRTAGEPTGAKPSVMLSSLRELLAVRRAIQRAAPSENSAHNALSSAR